MLSNEKELILLYVCKEIHFKQTQALRVAFEQKISVLLCVPL